MPKFGLGTYHMHDSETIRKSVTELGYRMLDCASFYKNEEVVGKAIEGMMEDGFTRDDLFVISKVWWDEVEDIEAACRRSLEKLGLQHLDLYLVHWPVAMKPVPGEKDKFEQIKIPMHKIWA